MSKRIATDPSIIGSARFHEIEYDAHHARAGREHLHLPMSATWNGATVEFEMEATRYVPSDGNWTSWNVFVDAGEYRSDSMTDTARAAIRDVAVPIAHEWLAGADYSDSRALAFAYMVKGLIREDASYGASTHRSSEALAKYHAELFATDDLNLARAIKALDEYQAIMESVPSRTEGS